MSTEEDTELRDLVAQTLEVNGCLPKIRAELRASIFLALDEDDELQKREPLLNTKVKSALESQEGRIMFCLVREFLEFFGLDFTLSVYEPESYLGTSYQYEGRSKIVEGLGISQLAENPALPLLLQLIQIAKVTSVQPTKNIDINLRKLQSLDSVRNKLSDEVVKDCSTSVSEVSRETNGVLNPVTEIHAACKDNLNETFDLSAPSINLNKTQPVEVILSPRSMESSRSTNEKDDTYDGTSSIAEDSMKDDLDKSTQSSEAEFSPPVLKDSKSHSKFDVSLKLSPQKAEKLKAKASLSSLADLPPLQLSKSRNDTLLLPSLYSKEFKERATNQNLREIDKLFDVDADNYEEDFMSESELNLNKSPDSARNTDLQSSSFTDSNKNITSLSIKSAENKNLNNRKSANFERVSNQNVERNKTGVIVSPKSVTSSVASDDLNLNIDDILNSPTSN